MGFTLKTKNYLHGDLVKVKEKVMKLLIEKEENNGVNYSH